MNGQWPAERAPLLLDINDDGKQEIVIVNRGGQVLMWTLDGMPIGSGQDGTMIQLPQGRWTSKPVAAESSENIRMVTCSVEGLVVGLDAELNLKWHYQLPGETTWGYALPAVYSQGSETLFVFGDHSGTLTCLNDKGTVQWSLDMQLGKCSVPLQSIHLKNGGPAFLVPLGTTLCCFDTSGKILWSMDFEEIISTQPEIIITHSSDLIACGTKEGSLWGLDIQGNLLWKVNIGDEVNAFLASYPLENMSPMILCTGLWGNLFAFDMDGHQIWKHAFRAKGRGVPLLFDTDGDGDYEIVVSTYAQHLYAFDQNGYLVDDVRVNGAINSSPLAVYDDQRLRYDVLVTTASLLTYRLRPSPAVSPYSAQTSADSVDLDLLLAQSEDQSLSILVNNPNAALIGVNLEITNIRGNKTIQGTLSARSKFEVPIGSPNTKDLKSIRAVIRNRSNILLTERTWQNFKLPTAKNPEKILRVWATPAYGDFDQRRLYPMTREVAPGKAHLIQLKALYMNEIDQGAFILASKKNASVYLRMILEEPKRDDGTRFAGTILPYQVVSTGSVNGERVPDALLKLNTARIIPVPPQQALKIWLSVDTRSSKPGIYEGKIYLISLASKVDTIKLALSIDVLDLKMPDTFPITLCTWDYIPNRWFPDHSDRVLGDMTRHGVTIFPRSSIPQAQMNSKGQLMYDWSILEADLKRLHGRGVILFHISKPPIIFTEKASDTEKRAGEIQYMRDFRDYLKGKGWDYNDYAFYPLDEPGLHYGENIPVFIKAARLFREADPRLRIYTDPVPGLSWKDFKQMEPFLDIWCPNMRLVSGLLSGDPRMNRIMKSKGPVWSYECESYVKSLSPLRYNRANAWRAKYFGLDGIGFWTHSTTDKDHWFAGETFHDEYALVYPGEVPVPSIRWEAVRDGLEDAAAISMLQEQIQYHSKLNKKEEMVKKAEKALKIALTDIMELSDLAYVESRDYLREGDRRVWHTWSDIETYHRHRMEIARLTRALMIGQ